VTALPTARGTALRTYVPGCRAVRGGSRAHGPSDVRTGPARERPEPVPPSSGERRALRAGGPNERREEGS